MPEMGPRTPGDDAKILLKIYDTENIFEDNISCRAKLNRNHQKESSSDFSQLQTIDSSFMHQNRNGGDFISPSNFKRGSLAHSSPNNPRQRLKHLIVVPLSYTANDELLANAVPFSCLPGITQWQVSNHARNGTLRATAVVLSGGGQLKFLAKGKKGAFDWQKIRRVTARPHHQLSTERTQKNGGWFV
jgi:hypothetical protein